MRVLKSTCYNQAFSLKVLKKLQNAGLGPGRAGFFGGDGTAREGMR
jgi:hypothetical protein